MAAVAVARPVDELANQLASTTFFQAEEKPARQPDIQYHPNEERYKSRTARRLAENPSLLTSPLPDGFQKRLESPLVWEGNDFNDEEWVYELSPDHLREIDDAAKHFRSLGKTLGHVSSSTFPLPTLGPVLRDLAKELHNGREFFVLRTFPVDDYSRGDNILIYAGVSSYVGELRAIQDVIGAPPYTTDKQVFHTDQGDIVALFALDVAAQGGTSRISSSWRAYNELAATRPDLVKTLAEPWPLDGFGGNPAYTERPLLFYYDNKVIVQYARRAFTGFLGLPRSPDIPPITEAQAEALDALHFLGEKFILGLNFQKGDIQSLDGSKYGRHLLRLWLRNEELAWKTPEELQAQWKRLYYSAIPDEQQFAVEPIIRDGARGGPKYT